MNAPPPDARRSTPLRLLVLAALFCVAASGCTIVVHDPQPQPGNNGHNDPPPPRVLDVLVLTQLDRSAGNLAPMYGQILSQLEADLGRENVALRQVGFAPLHRRAQDVVPLIYGRTDGSQQGDFASPGEAISFYATDNGGQYLQQMATGEGENLAALGMSLDQRAIYHPTSADPSAAAYFKAPADGFVVLTFSASKRLCGADEQACQLDGEAAGTYFTAKDADGNATWLSLPGGSGLPPGRIFHAAFVTAEGVDYNQFASHCRGFPNFPNSDLDFMEGSQKRYYGPVAKAINNHGGHAAVVDLCKAFSGDGDKAVRALADKIAGMH